MRAADRLFWAVSIAFFLTIVAWFVTESLADQSSPMQDLPETPRPPCLCFETP